VKILPLISAVAIGCTTGMIADDARAYTQLCAGPTVHGVSGPITNGSSCQMTLSGTSIDLLFIASEAADEDVVSLNGAAVFDNKTTLPGGSTSLAIAPGNLQFELTNKVTGVSYLTATAYKNFDGRGRFQFYPVYHFAYFDISSEADFNALFGPGGKTGGVSMTAAENAYILGDGGYSAFTFVGVEDLSTRRWDDWNDLVFAFRDPGGSTGPNPPPTPGVPEPSTWAMMLLGFAGLGFAGFRRASKGTAEAGA
jgi:hypothetical protein